MTDEQTTNAGAGPVERGVGPGAEAITLVERLRQRAGQYDEYAWHSEIELEAAAEIERMQASLRVCFAAADAARYRWLRTGENAWRVLRFTAVDPEQCGGDVLERAIDAAMRADACEDRKMLHNPPNVYRADALTRPTI